METTTAKFDPRALLEAIGKIGRAKLDATEAAGVVQAAHKAAKAEGLNLDALKLCLRIRRMDPLEGQALLLTTIAYLQASESPAVAQTDLFRDAPSVPPAAAHSFRIEQLEIAGRMAARNGSARLDHPFEQGSEEAAAWVRGWDQGDAAKPEQDGPASVAVQPARGRPGPKVSDAAPPVAANDAAPRKRGRPRKNAAA